MNELLSPKMDLGSGTDPDSFIITTVRLSDISDSTERFFEENFRGAVTFDIERNFFGYTDVSPVGLAYFLKLILRCVYGKTVVRIVMQKSGKDLMIKASWNADTPLYEKDMAELYKVASLSGFTASFSEDSESCSAELLLPIKILKSIQIYALSEFKMRKALIRVFFS